MVFIRMKLYIFLKKNKESEREKELVIFIRIKQNIFLEIINGYYKNKN